MDIFAVLEQLHLHEMLLLLKVPSLLHICSASAEVMSSIYTLHQSVGARLSSELEIKKQCVEQH